MMLFGIRLEVVRSEGDNRGRGICTLEGRGGNPLEDTYYSEEIPLRVAEQIRGLSIDDTIYDEMSNRMTDPSRARGTIRAGQLGSLAGGVNVVTTDEAATLSADMLREARDRLHQSRVNPPVFVASTSNGETFGRSAVYDQAVDRNPSRESDCPASRIGVECRQWTDEQLQSVRTILIQEGKRRKHGES